MRTLNVKKRLMAYMESEKYIESLIERYERLKAQLEGISSPGFSNMPRGGSGSSPDKLTNKIVTCDELRDKIEGKMSERDAERHCIEKMIEVLPKANQKSVLEMRYFDLMDWEDISQVLFGSREDFYDREDTYMRKVFYIHGEALAILEQISESDV